MTEFYKCCECCEEQGCWLGKNTHTAPCNLCQIPEVENIRAEMRDLILRGYAAESERDALAEVVARVKAHLDEYYSRSFASSVVLFRIGEAVGYDLA